MYDIEDDSHQEDSKDIPEVDEVTITETWEEATERKDKEKYEDKDGDIKWHSE